jgi:hypothetical protein
MMALRRHKDQSGTRQPKSSPGEIITDRAKRWRDGWDTIPTYILYRTL